MLAEHLDYLLTLYDGLGSCGKRPEPPYRPKGQRRRERIGTMIESYRTLSCTSEGLFKDRRSRFIGYAHPIRTPEEAAQLLADYRRMHHAARHHCHAYILGAEGDTFRADDDGEPSSSAGKPILDALRRENLTNCAAYVIRYFGGIKLGVPGLINAYRRATEEALAANRIVEVTVLSQLVLRSDYTAHHELMNCISALEGNVVRDDYDHRGSRITVQWPIEKIEGVKQRIDDLKTINRLLIEIEEETVID